MATSGDSRISRPTRGTGTSARSAASLTGWSNPGYLNQSPFRGVKNIRRPHRIVRPFSSVEIGSLLEACGDGTIGIRDRALILTLLDTGMRCSEAVELDCS